MALILYLGVLGTLLGHIGWNVGLRGLGPTRAVAYTYAISLLAVLIGAAVLDEELSPVARCRGRARRRRHRVGLAEAGPRALG